MKSALSYFSKIADPRVDLTKEHLLEDIIFIREEAGFSY